MVNEVRMKQLIIGVGILAIAFSLVTATFVISMPKNNETIKSVHVSSVSIEEPLIKDEETTIIINGGISSNCWKSPIYHEVDIYTNTKVVMIYLRAAYENPCYDMIGLPREYHYNISLIFPSSGSWSIYVNGKPIYVIVYD